MLYNEHPPQAALWTMRFQQASFVQGESNEDGGISKKPGDRRGSRTSFSGRRLDQRSAVQASKRRLTRYDAANVETIQHSARTTSSARPKNCRRLRSAAPAGKALEPGSGNGLSMSLSLR
jgi:hypothetical protein